MNYKHKTLNKCLYKYKLDIIKPALLQPLGFRSDTIVLYCKTSEGGRILFMGDFGPAEINKKERNHFRNKHFF